MTIVKSSGIICKGNIEGNFIAVPAEIFDYLELGLISPKDISVYIKLLDLYNENYGYAYPTISQLRRMVGIKSKTTVDKCLDSLEDVGLIERGKGMKGNNVYVVYKPYKKSELYQRYPGKVEKLEEYKRNLKLFDDQEKGRFKDWELDQKGKELKLSQGKRIVPNVSSEGMNVLY